MSAIDDPKTLGRARLSFADQHDIDEFLDTLETFERGAIGPDQWRAFRLHITTREACGNSVRNITCCPYAGVAKGELFDVTPFAEALTRYFLRHPLSSSLPRKFKIAFEGCPEDHAFTAIHDIGLKAHIRGTNGAAELGFRITAGGGTATMCRSGNLLHEFAPAGELLDVAEGIVRVFHRLGDREHKMRVLADPADSAGKLPSEQTRSGRGGSRSSDQDQRVPEVQGGLESPSPGASALEHCLAATA